MANRRVSIIERVKRNGKWIWGKKWQLPIKFTFKEGARRGKFYLLWYQGNYKQFTPVPPAKQEKLPDLKSSLLLAKMKQRHLEDAEDGLDRPDPIKPVNRVKIQEAVQKFVTQIELTKDPLTYKVYEQNLREYSEWTKLTYVDQVDKDHLFEYRKHVMDGGNERLTADWKDGEGACGGRGGGQLSTSSHWRLIGCGHDQIGLWPDIPAVTERYR